MKRKVMKELFKQYKHLDGGYKVFPAQDINHTVPRGRISTWLHWWLEWTFQITYRRDVSLDVLEFKFKVYWYLEYSTMVQIPPSLWYIFKKAATVDKLMKKNFKKADKDHTDSWYIWMDPTEQLLLSEGVSRYCILSSRNSFGEEENPLSLSQNVHQLGSLQYMFSWWTLTLRKCSCHSSTDRWSNKWPTSHGTH